jgi:(S)-ureidoglycine-glyoxylate aminotransferase
MRRRYDELTPPPRLLLGLGPANPDPRVLRALTAPPLGTLDPAYTPLLDEVADLSRFAFRATNLRSYAIAGPARAGLEAALASLIEDGDPVLVAVGGDYGARLAEVARRYGAAVDTVEAEEGRVVEPDALAARLRQRPTKLVAAVHVEPATGLVQPLDGLGRACHDRGALLLLDAALSLGGCEVSADRWGADLVVGSLARCLGGPAGIAPITYNTRVEAALGSRRRPARASCLDLALLQDYWSPDRLRLYPPPAPLVYALREALRLLHEEGLERRWKRHRRVAAALVAGLEALGLRLFGDPVHRAPHVAVVQLPASIADGPVRQQLVADYGVEIGAGVGPLYGRTWRIGLLGYNARLENALALLAALEHVLAAHGYPVLPYVGSDAARNHYLRAGVEG